MAEYITTLDRRVYVHDAGTDTWVPAKQPLSAGDLPAVTDPMERLIAEVRELRRVACELAGQPFMEVT